jgi:hypothetical protein
MSIALRANCLALGLMVALITGCDKAATTASGGASTTTAPGRPGDTAGSKLAGAWESVEEGKKDDDKATAEFKSDGGLTIVMGPFELTGTWKLTKEEGKTMTIETELTPKGLGEPGKADKKSFKIVFDDADTMTMTPTETPDPKKFKRKK